MTTPTKALVLGAVLGCSLFALPAVAQTAAATLPDAFGQPAAAAPATRAAPPAPVSAEAPDIARAEQALRAVIASLQSRQIDYSVFSPNLAEQIRSRAAEFAPRIQQLGAVRTVEHRGQQDGADLFRVVFEKQATDWVIGFDDEDQIAALLYRPAPG